MLTKEFLIENKRNLQNLRDQLTLDNIPEEFKYDENNYQFVHEHVHSDHSRLDGASKVSDYIQKAADLGIPGVAITDHGMFNALVEMEDSLKKITVAKSKEVGHEIFLNGIYGMEGYMCSDMFFRRETDSKETLTDKEKELLNERYHIILLAKDNIGVQAIKILSSLAFINGFYKKPRFDFKLFTSYMFENDHSKGRLCDHLVVFSGCLAGEVPKAILADNYEKAKEVAKKFKENVEDYYLELQLHMPTRGDRELGEHEKELIRLQEKVNKGLIKLSKELNIPIVCTSDCHYVEPDGYITQDLLSCIDSGKTIDDTTRFKIESQELYFKHPKEMNMIFKDYPDALINTVIVNNLCNVKKVTTDDHYLPEFKIPKEFKDAADYLTHLAWEGYDKKYTEKYVIEKLIPAFNKQKLGGESNYTKEKVYKVLKDRMEYELRVIISMGYDNYYLICWDVLNWAFSEGIPLGRGRGSGAGSIIAYVTGIVWVDPMRWGLIFERFLNPERVSLPDFDNDVCYERRGEVIDYLVEKYGSNNVSQIIAFGKLLAKGAARDIARAYGLPVSLGDKIAKKIPDKAKNLKQALEQNPELKEMYDKEPDIKKVIDGAIRVEGLTRNFSTHAAGVVLMKRPTYYDIPVCRTKDGGVQTQVDKDPVERLGGVKFDFLGLKTATVHNATRLLIKRHLGIDIDLYDMDVDDPKVYEFLRTGETVGVFQLENLGMRMFMKELQPTCFEDIIAGISLYRPGPMEEIPTYIKGKRNPEDIHYDDPQMEHILDVTYGVMVYQEQVMQVVRDLAGYTFGRSDLVRRAMAKKKTYLMEAEKQIFIYGEIKCPECGGTKYKNGQKCLHCGGTGVVACTEPNQKGEVTVKGCIRNGVSKEAAEKIYSKMSDFASYAFNKSHACAYAKTSYEGLFFETYYPVYFFVALLTSVMDKTDKTIAYISACKKKGIDVFPPDVNESEVGYSVTSDQKSIRVGLTAIKKVGNSVAQQICEERELNGKFTDLSDFKRRMEGKVNSGALESIIKVGGFNSVYPNRNSLLLILDEISDYKKESQNEATLRDVYGGGLLALAGDTNFGYVDPNQINKIPETVLPTAEEISHYEKELLGIYITAHPLDTTKEILYDNVTITGDSLEALEIRDGSKVIIGGVINTKINKPTRSGTMMSTLVIDDATGAFINVVVFSKNYQKFSEFNEEDIVIIKGRANYKVKFGTEDEMEIQIMGEDIRMFDSKKPMTNTYKSEMTKNVFGGYYMVPEVNENSYSNVDYTSSQEEDEKYITEMSENQNSNKNADIMTKEDKVIVDTEFKEITEIKNVVELTEADFILFTKPKQTIKYNFFTVKD